MLCEIMLNYFLPLCYDVGAMYLLKFGLQFVSHRH
jgi:hypothetical protein